MMARNDHDDGQICQEQSSNKSIAIGLEGSSGIRGDSQQRPFHSMESHQLIPIIVPWYIPRGYNDEGVKQDP